MARELEQEIARTRGTRKEPKRKPKPRTTQKDGMKRKGKFTTAGGTPIIESDVT